MDKKLLIFVLLAVVLMLPATANAMVSNLQCLLVAITRAAGLIFSGIAVVCFLISGVLFLTAGGDPEKTQAARSSFVWGIAGVVVGIIAFSIVAIISSALQ